MVSRETECQILRMVIQEEGRGLATSSDHSWIDIELDLNSNLKEQEDINLIRKWNINLKTDWKDFQNELKPNLEKWLA